MERTKKNILLTGIPGIGKTTLMENLFQAIRDLNPIGFYTSEVREEGVRKGFELVSLDGRKGLLSHVKIRSPYRVGKYKIDIKGFEDFLDSIPFLDLASTLILIDEIGKMECLSIHFKKLLTQVLDSDKKLVATIALKGEGFISEIKKRSDVRLFEITERNRNTLLSDLLAEIKKDKNELISQ
jgi:nucleoside-triphosphatase